MPRPHNPHAVMHAKMRVAAVTPNGNPGDAGYTESLSFSAVGPKGSYPADGSDEDNSYARWSPSGSLSLCVANPNLHGKFEQGKTYYIDFIPADEPPAA